MSERDLLIEIFLFVFMTSVFLYAGIHRRSTPSQARVAVYFAIGALVIPTIGIWLFFAIFNPGEFLLIDYLLFNYQPGVKRAGRALLPFQYSLLITAMIGWIRTKLYYRYRSH
jgi:hypothetical protein